MADLCFDPRFLLYMRHITTYSSSTSSEGKLFTPRGLIMESERLYLFELVILTRLMAQGNRSWLLARDSLEIRTRIKTASSDPDHRCSAKRVWRVVQKREIEIRSMAVRATLASQTNADLISAGHGRQSCCVSWARVCSIPPSAEMFTVEKTHKLRAVTEQNNSRSGREGSVCGEVGRFFFSPFCLTILEFSSHLCTTERRWLTMCALNFMNVAGRIACKQLTTWEEHVNRDQH